MSSPVLVRWRGFTITRARALQTGGIVVLLVLGAVLPYVRLAHYNRTVELVTSSTRLFDAGALLGGFDVGYLPSWDAAVGSGMNVAFNVIAVGPGLQQVATVVALCTCWGLFFDEINKFFWWPLHLSGYALVAVPLPLFIGLNLVRSYRVDISIGPGWVPAVLAGVGILVVTFRARNRIDSYGGI